MIDRTRPGREAKMERTLRVLGLRRPHAREEKYKRKRYQLPGVFLTDEHSNRPFYPNPVSIKSHKKGKVSLRPPYNLSTSGST